MLARKAKEALEDRKADNILILDMQGLSSITDFYLIATGHNAPHLRALAEELDRRLGAEGTRCYRMAGTPESEWMVADYVDLVVHIFTPRTRTFYDLERLWCDAPRLK
ncbi:MAG: Ribosomal silencing factor RsfS [Verrucomicrobia bacterium ADurb.Bin345]|nr:MAG: Ribosomal silencing factor RsfS [Verrucomicrobia bacterium ADurb.Bin345]